MVQTPEFAVCSTLDCESWVGVPITLRFALHYDPGKDWGGEIKQETSKRTQIAAGAMGTCSEHNNKSVWASQAAILPLVKMRGPCRSERESIAHTPEGE